MWLNFTLTLFSLSQIKSYDLWNGNCILVSYRQCRPSCDRINSIYENLLRRCWHEEEILLTCRNFLRHSSDTHWKWVFFPFSLFFFSHQLYTTCSLRTCIHKFSFYADIGLAGFSTKSKILTFRGILMFFLRAFEIWEF